MKKITIILRSEQGQWIARVSKSSHISWDIQEYGNSKEHALNLAKAKTLRGIADLYESHDIKLDSFIFRATDSSVAGKPLKRLTERLASCYKYIKNWIIETPYLEFFLRISLNASVLYIAILSCIFVGLIINFVYSLFQNKQVFATFFASSVAFVGVLLSVAIQSLIAIYKDRRDRQSESVKKMTEYYEKIVKVLRNPGKFPLKEALEFINEFSDKVEIYGSSNVLHQWKHFKERIIEAQINPVKIEIKDLHNFRNFIWAIRKEMGYFNENSMNRHNIYKELKKIYGENKKIKL
ncbi:MAG: hypothetical protein ACFB4I_03005 [Cyanophyceae cyanobacterium]